ncbi:MAG: hypothetical protein GIW95_07190 [Candidatus Eremiobacteraeota bacterium]|nr:hypothetical protein [Candidatus Eremiobacteraeota bacterium]
MSFPASPLALLIAALALTQQPAPPAPGQSPVPASPTPVASPAASVSPVPTLAPTPLSTTPAPPTPAPAPTPELKYRFVPKQPASLAPGDPQIYAIYLNDKVLKDFIAIRVATNESVTKVISRSNGQSGTVPKVGPGEFYAISKLPPIPPIAHGFGFTIEFVASNDAGKTESVKVPVRLK